MRNQFTLIVQYLIWAMEKRGIMTTQAIYRSFKSVCEKFGHELADEWQAEVRQTLQSHCRSRPQWNKKDDFFEYHGRGYWLCKVTSPTISELL